MVIMASGIARGRVRTTAATTTTESPDRAVILQIIERFSNRTGTSFEDARAREIVWTRLSVPRLTSPGQGHVSVATGN